MALSADRETKHRAGVDTPYPVAADAKIFTGALVAVSAAGFLVPAAATSGLAVVGVALGSADNTGGSNGDLAVVVRRGHEFLLGASGLSQTDVGRPVYVVDDETVAAEVAGTDVAAEELVADAGGATTVFEGFLANGAVVPGSVVIDATVAAAGVQMTDDGAGKLSGDGVGAGLVDYASGYYRLIFDTAPDDDTAITADYEHGAIQVQAGLLAEFVSATSGWVLL